MRSSQLFIGFKRVSSVFFGIIPFKDEYRSSICLVLNKSINGSHPKKNSAWPSDVLVTIHTIVH